MKFNTAGSAGDSVYQTLFMREFSETCKQKIEEIHFQYGKKASFSQEHPYGDQQLTKGAAEFLAPLFEAQGWKVSISDIMPEGYLDVDNFRRLQLNFASGDIRLWCYNLAKPCMPMNLQRKTIFVDADKRFRDKIILAKTSRYNNVYLDYNVLKPLQKQIMMIGLEEEHKAFCSNYFDVDFYKVKDALEAAQIIKGAKMMIANQCGLYSLAEQMKTPRILCTAEVIEIKHPQTGQMIWCPGPVNVIPQGGQCFMVGTTQKLQLTLQEIK